jgi:hypothetical protein
MHKIELEIPEIPHGHGLSFKRGIADGLLENHDHEKEPHSTHTASYKRGIKIGEELKHKINELVKV